MDVGRRSRLGIPLVALILASAGPSRAAQCEGFAIYSGYSVGIVDSGPMDPNWTCALSEGAVETNQLGPGATYVQVYWYGTPPVGTISLNGGMPIPLVFSASGIPEGPEYVSDPTPVNVDTRTVVAAVNDRTAQVTSPLPS